MKNYFNLVDEPWIPVANHNRVSLSEIFSNSTLKAISGNALHKVSLLKLLLAIAQRAYTPEDDEEWKTLESAGLAQKCLNYLEEKKDLFWLYGEKPFLQKVDLATAKTTKGEPISLSVIGKDYPPDLPLENESIVFESQLNQELTDAEKAVLIVSMMNYSLAGKRIAKNVPPWTKGYSGKTTSAKGGPSIGNYHGYQNSHLVGESLIDTIWLNIFTRSQLNLFPQWENDPLIPPWEEFPKGEDDSIARRLKESFMSTLCAVSRFLLLKDGGMIYVEGLQYPSHKEGWREPFMTYASGPEGRIIWNNPTFKPWRNLPALLSTAFHGTDAKFNSPQIGLLILRSRHVRDIVGIWAGGLKVRGTAGDMSVKQSDDFIDSITFFKTKDLGDPWFKSFENEILELENIEYQLRRAINGYYKSLSSLTPSALPKAEALFWELCSQQAQRLVDVCDEQEEMDSLRKEFIGYAYQAYNTYCPNQTARQMSSWARNSPSFRRRGIKNEEVPLVK